MTITEIDSAPTTRTTVEGLRHLPTTARPCVDARDVVAPPGYTVEALIVGLSLPTKLEFSPDGLLFIGEGGSTWPTRPAMPPRILTYDPASGALEVFATEEFAGPRGFAFLDNSVYVSSKGGYRGRIDVYDRTTRERRTLIEEIPSGGWHEPGGPIIGPHDGLLYFGHGSVSLNGIVGPAGFTVDIAKHPMAHDVPGADVTLTGDNDWSRHPAAVYPFITETGPYKPYGVPSQKGEKIQGQLWCSTGIWRCKPDGTDVELIAWGVRNPWGMTFSPDGDLYVADLCMEEKDPRPVGQDPGRVWHIKNARTPHGSVTTPDWYGFPDICGDGLPVDAPEHRPLRGPAPTRLLADPPPWAGPAVYLNEPHTGNGSLAYCPHEAFGHPGRLFLCQFGTYWPLNSMRPEHEHNGFNVVAIDPSTGQSEVFLSNRVAGPASAHPGTGGLERPVDCAFSPDGRSLYVLDFGLNTATKNLVVAYAHTGVLWRVTRQ